MKVFVGYAHEDREVVASYVQRLERERGVEVFWDKKIPEGMRFLEVIAKEASEASALLVFVSQAACKSGFIPREVLVAQRQGVPVIPIWIESYQEDSPASGLELALAGIEAIPAYEMDFDTTYRALWGAVQRTTDRALTATVISIMGMQGGVGKSTLVVCIAELIASTGANVLLIDADIETGGLTKYTGPRVRRRPHIWTVLDAAYAKTEEPDPQTNPDMGLWDVTPPYLQKEQFGTIHLVPGRAGDRRPGWDPLARIPVDERNAEALDILKSTCTRGASVPGGVDCIIVDAGAENNPLVSAGFAMADYGYIVLRPNPEFREDVSRYDELHRGRFPEHGIDPMHVIVNQATPTTPRAWQGVHGVSFIPDDPIMRLLAAEGTFDFDGVGLADFFVAVLEMLHGHFRSEDQGLLPNEADVWIRPRMKQIVERRLPQTTLKSPSFRTAKIGGYFLTVFGIVLTLVLGSLSFFLARRPAERQVHSLGIIELDSREQAALLQQQIHEGEDFADLAKQFSTHAETQRNGGQLGQLLLASEPLPGIGTLPGLEEALARASRGALCPEIFSTNGKFYLVKLVGTVTEPVEPSLTYQSARFLVAVGIVACACGAVVGVWLTARIRRRTRLLVEVAARGTDSAFLEELLRRSPEKGELKWLKTLLDEALEHERSREIAHLFH